MFKTADDLAAAARLAVERVTVTDVHTHLFPPAHEGLLLWGADELITYHYLVAELFTMAPRGLTSEDFRALPKSAQADLIWEHVFIRGGALSEAARGVLTTFTRLGLDVGKRDLPGIRKWYAGQKIADFLPRAFDLAGLDFAVMTNNPFHPAERAALTRDLPCPACLKTALRIDTLLLDYRSAMTVMVAEGYDVKARPDARTFEEVRRFLLDWCGKLKPVYMAASLPDTFAYPDDGLTGKLLDKAVLPAAQEAGIPLAMMIGVRRQVNPLLGDAGDGLGVSDLSAVANLCREYPRAKFLVTVLARVNQHELAVLARKFANLHVFGCWWFLNNPSIIEEMTRQRIELLGTAFTAQHSDARVLDQVIYKWTHSRQVIGKVLSDKYRDLFAAGWRPTPEEVTRSARALLGGSFGQFLAR